MHIYMYFIQLTINKNTKTYQLEVVILIEPRFLKLIYKEMCSS